MKCVTPSGSEMLPNLSMKRLRDGFKNPCIESSRNLSADDLISAALYNIQNLMRSKLRAAFLSIAGTDTPNTESSGLGGKKLL